MNHVNEIEQQVSSWPGVSVHAHRFGGTEFRCDRAEIGHVHTGGTVDIPFSRAIRDALLAKGLAEEHRWVPNSGWITFHLRGEDGLRHALWLMRLSYLRYALKRATDPEKLLAQESQEPCLTPQFTSLLQAFASRGAHAGSPPLPSSNDISETLTVPKSQ